MPAKTNELQKWFTRVRPNGSNHRRGHCLLFNRPHRIDLIFKDIFPYRGILERLGYPFLCSSFYVSKCSDHRGRGETFRVSLFGCVILRGPIGWLGVDCGTPVLFVRYLISPPIISGHVGVPGRHFIHGDPVGKWENTRPLTISDHR